MTEQQNDQAAQPIFRKADTSDIAALSYEAAREELVATVNRLETGGASLEESLALWERGEALAQHCQNWLDGARARIAEVTGNADNAAADDSGESAPF